MTDLMHFKFTHDGSWHRFVLPTRGGRKVFRRLKKRILLVLGAAEQQIWWDDGDTINCLNDSVDLVAAIAFAEKEGQLLSTIPCVYIQFDPTPSAQTGEMEPDFKQAMRDALTSTLIQVRDESNRRDEEARRRETEKVDDSIRDRIEQIAAMSEEMLNSTFAVQQAIELSNVEELTGLRIISEKISRVDAMFTEQERVLADIMQNTEDMQWQLNEQWLERKIQAKDATQPENMSLEEERLARLGYLPCSASSTTTTPQVPSHAVRTVERGTEAPPLDQSELSPEEKRLAHLGFLPCTTARKTKTTPAVGVVERGTCPPFEYVAPGPVAQAAPLPYDVSLQQQRLAHYPPRTAEKQTDTDPNDWLEQSRANLAPLNEWLKKNRMSLVQTDATTPDADVYIPKAATTPPTATVSIPSSELTSTMRDCASSPNDLAAFEAGLEIWLWKMLAAEILDEAFPAPTAVPDDAAAASDEVPLELQSLFAALDAAEAIADDDSDSEDVLDEPIALPSSPSAFNVHCRSREAQSLLASLDKAEAIADDSETEYVLDDADGILHVCAADPRGVSGPHSRSQELLALLASLEKTEAIVDTGDVLDDVTDVLNTAPIPNEVVLGALDAPRCRSRDLLSLLASLEKREAIADDGKDTEARIDAALAVPTDHGRAVDLVTYLESLSISDDVAAPEAVIDDPAPRYRSAELRSLLASLENPEATDDVIAVPTSPSGISTLPSAAYIDSVVSQVAAARAAVEAVATIDMEKEGRLPTISESAKDPSPIFTLPRTLNTDAYGLLFVGSASEQSIAAAKSKLVSDVPLGKPATIEAQSNKKRRREEEKKEFDTAIRAMGGRVEGDDEEISSVQTTSEERKALRKQIRAMGGTVDSSEDEDVAPVEANNAPSPVPIERAPQFDRLVRAWTRTDEESNAAQSMETGAVAAEQLTAQLRERMPPSTVEMPVAYESVFDLGAEAAAEMYGADSFAAAQLAMIRDAHGPAPRYSQGSLTGAEVLQQRARYEEAKRWLAGIMATSPEGPIWMAPAADAPASAWTSTEDFLKNLDEIDRAAAQIRNEFGMMSTEELMACLGSMGAERTETDEQPAATAPADAPHAAVNDEQPTTAPSLTESEQETSNTRYEDAKQWFAAQSALWTRPAAPSAPWTVGNSNLVDEQLRTMADQFNTDPSVAAATREYQRNQRKYLRNRITEMKNEAARLAAEAVPVTDEQSTASASSDAPRAAAEDNVVQRPASAAVEEGVASDAPAVAAGTADQITVDTAASEWASRAEHRKLVADQMRKILDRFKAGPSASETPYAYYRNFEDLVTEQIKSMTIGVEKDEAEEPRERPRLNFQPIIKSNEGSVLTQEVRDEVADAAEQSTKEQRRAAVAMLAIELSQEATSPEVFIMLLSDVLKSRPRAALMPFIEVILPYISSALLTDDIVSVDSLGDRLAERFIELQASSDAVIVEATLTAPRWIDDLLHELQRPPPPPPSQKKRDPTSSIEKFKAQLKQSGRGSKMQAAGKPTLFANTPEERRAELEKKKAMLARMRETKKRSDAEMKAHWEDFGKRVAKKEVEYKTNKAPAETPALKTDIVTNTTPHDRTVSNEEDAIARYAEEDRRRDSEKLRMRDQARLAAQRMDEKMEKKRAEEEYEKYLSAMFEEEELRYSDIPNKWQRSELALRKMGERWDRERVHRAREELEKLANPTSEQEKEEKERLTRKLESLEDFERASRMILDELLGAPDEEQENMEGAREDVVITSRKDKGMNEREWKDEKERLSQICEKYCEKLDRQEEIDEEQENVRMVEKMERKRASREEEALYERERKEEKERITQILNSIKESEKEFRKMNEEVVGTNYEEQENVRMVEKYIQRENESVRLRIEREQQDLQKAIYESEKLHDAVQAKHEAKNTHWLEEEKRKNQLKTIRTLINNITPETADALTKEFLEHRVHEWSYMNDVVSIIFDKAVDQPDYCHLFANLCYKQVEEELKTNTNNVSLFRNSIVLRAQETFNPMERDGVVKAQKSLLDAASNEYSKKQLQMDLTQTQNKWRKRKLGNIIFMGHLFVQKLISIRIISYCIVDLLQSLTDRKEEIDEASIECAVRLLETTGARLQEDMDVADYVLRAPFTQLRAPTFPMEKVFETLEVAAPQMSNPLSAMIKNLIELRKNGWVAKTSATLPTPSPEADEKKDKKEDVQKPVDDEESFLVSTSASTWKCQNCCFINRAAEIKCFCCGSKPITMKPNAPSLSIIDVNVLKTSPKWDCLFCRVSNKGTDVQCEYCGESKPVKKKKKPTSPDCPVEPSEGASKPKFPISSGSLHMTRRIGQCVINYGTHDIELDEARDRILKLVYSKKYDQATPAIVFKRFMAAAVQKSSAAMGGREVAPAFGQVLAACLRSPPDTFTTYGIFKGITEFCREVVAKEAWRETPKVWDIVAEVLVASHQTYGSAVPPRPCISDLQEVFDAAANDMNSACTLFVMFLEKFVEQKHKRDNFAETLNDIVSLIFDESEKRPMLNRFLASMCTAQINKERVKDVDAFRSALLVRAQATLTDQNRGTMTRDLSERPCAEAFAELKKIKFANIMFIGQLYLHGIFSSRIVMQCISNLQGRTFKGAGQFGKVDSDSVECAVHLITLCGEKLDQEAALPPATENADRVVSEKSLDSIFDTLNAAARVVKDSVKLQILHLATLRSNGWKTPLHNKQAIDTPNDPKEIDESSPSTHHPLLKRLQEQEKANSLRLEEVRMKEKVSSVLFDTTFYNKEEKTRLFLSYKVHESHALDKIVSLIFDRAVEMPHTHKLFASLCAAQIAAEIRDSGDSKFLQAVYDRICDVLEKDTNTLHVLHLEAAILKETNVYKKMLTQADLCQAKTDAKKVKLANIKFLSEIYLLNADVELARLLQTCLVNLLQTAFASRNHEEGAVMDWDSYSCAVDILALVGKLLEEDTNKRAEDAKSVDPSTPPTLDDIFETLLYTSPRYGSFAFLGEKVRRLFDLREHGWVVPPSKCEILINKAIALLDSIPADKLVEEFNNIHGVTDTVQVKRLISHIFDKAAEHPEDAMFYASFCANLIARERAGAEGHVPWIGSTLLAGAYEILDMSHYDKIVKAKEMEIQFVFDEAIKMTMVIDLIDLKCNLRKKTFNQIQFIGHLFLNDVVHAAVLEHAVVNLLKTIAKNPMGTPIHQAPDEESIECALQLLQLCGSRLHDEIVRAALSGYSTPFNMHDTFDHLLQAKPRLNERLGLIIEQLVERRSNGWTSTPIRNHDNPCNEPWDLDCDYSEPDYLAAYEDYDNGDDEEEVDDNEETSDDDDEDEKKIEKPKEAAGDDETAKAVEGLPLPEGRWWESVQAQLESTGVKPKMPEEVEETPKEPATVEVKEVTPFRLPYSPMKSENVESVHEDDKDVEIAADALELVESLVEAKPDGQKAGAYSPTQTGMEESYPIPASIPSSTNGNSDEAPLESLNVHQEDRSLLARQPYSDDEGDTTPSSASSTSTSSTSSSTSSWSKVESVDSSSEYSNIDPASDSEM